MLDKRQITDQTIELVKNIRYNEDGIPVFAEWDDAFLPESRFLTDDQMVQLEKFLKFLTLN